MSNELKEARGKLERVREQLTALDSKRNAEGKRDWAVEDRESFLSLSKEAEALHKEYKRWEEVEDANRRFGEVGEDLKRATGSAPFSVGSRRDESKANLSIGELFVNSAQFKAARESKWSNQCVVDFDNFNVVDLKNGGRRSDAEFKTTMTTAAGFAPFVTRLDDVVPYAFRSIRVPQLMPTITTNETSIKYMEETTHTEAAAATAENTALSESAIAYTERTVQIEDIGAFIPATERQLDDAPQVIGLINFSLGEEVMRAEEAQMVTGTGTTPQLLGFLSSAAASAGVQTQALGTDSVITGFMKALTKVRFTGFAEPSASVWHPNDWQDVVTLQDANGNYIFGNPSAGGPSSLWGVPVVVTPAETENTCLVGDFRMYAYVARRQGLRIDIGWISTDFTQRKKTIRAYVRTALVIRRKAAFCKLTGI